MYLLLICLTVVFSLSGMQELSFDPNQIEPLTLGTFQEAINECIQSNKQYIIAVTTTKRDDGIDVNHFYDGKNLFENYTKNKNLKDPGTNLDLEAFDINYYRLHDNNLELVASQHDINLNTDNAQKLNSLLYETTITINESKTTANNPRYRPLLVKLLRQQSTHSACAVYIAVTSALFGLAAAIIISEKSLN